MYRLKAVQIKNLADGKYGDGHGLMLVRKGGTGKWVYRYSHLGRRRQMGLGTQEIVTLAEARRLRDYWRSILAQGRDPIEARNAQRSAEMERRDADDPTFKNAVDRVFEARKAGLRGDGQRGRWRSPLDLHIIPAIGHLRVSQLTREDIYAALKPLWGTKQPTAEKAYQRTRSILVDLGRMGIATNPTVVDQAVYMLGQVRHETVAIVSTPWRDIPALYARLSNTVMSELCLRWIILTAVRSDAARGCLKSEIDGTVWTVPAHRMKAREGKARPFRVPLSTEAQRVAHLVQDHPSPLLFPGRMDKAMSDQALTKRLDQMGEPGRVHGFRSSFRTWVQDTRAVDRETAEVALAHEIMGKTEAAYARSDLLELRAVAMQRWSDFVTGTATADVVPLRG